MKTTRHSQGAPMRRVGSGLDVRRHRRADRVDRKNPEPVLTFARMNWIGIEVTGSCGVRGMPPAGFLPEGAGLDSPVLHHLSSS